MYMAAGVFLDGGIYPPDSVWGGYRSAQILLLPDIFRTFSMKEIGSINLNVYIHSKNCGVKITPPVLIEDHTVHFTPVLNLWC